MSQRSLTTPFRSGRGLPSGRSPGGGDILLAVRFRQGGQERVRRQSGADALNALAAMIARTMGCSGTLPTVETSRCTDSPSPAA